MDEDKGSNNSEGESNVDEDQRPTPPTPDTQEDQDEQQ